MWILEELWCDSAATCCWNCGTFHAAVSEFHISPPSSLLLHLPLLHHLLSSSYNLLPPSSFFSSPGFQLLSPPLPSVILLHYPASLCFSSWHPQIWSFLATFLLLLLLCLLPFLIFFFSFRLLFLTLFLVPLFSTFFSTWPSSSCLRLSPPSWTRLFIETGQASDKDSPGNGSV